MRNVRVSASNKFKNEKTQKKGIGKLNGKEFRDNLVKLFEYNKR